MLPFVLLSSPAWSYAQLRASFQPTRTSDKNRVCYAMTEFLREQDIQSEIEACNGVEITCLHFAGKSGAN